MIGGFDITPDKWYHKLWFYPLMIALLIFVTVREWATDLYAKMKRREVR